MALDIAPDEEARRALALYDVLPHMVEKFSGYNDSNYFVELKCKNDAQDRIKRRDCVLKIMCPDSSSQEGFIEAVADVLATIDLPDFKVPRPIKTLSGRNTGLLHNNQEVQKVLLLTYIPGLSFYDITFDAELYLELCHEVGRCAGLLDRTLQELRDLPEVLHHEKYDYKLENLHRSRKKLGIVNDPVIRQICSEVMDRFEQSGELYKGMKRGLIHQDLWPENLIYELQDKPRCKVVGVVDFSDSLISCYLFEIGIVVAGVMYEAVDMGGISPLLAAKTTLSEYLNNFDFERSELSHLYWAVLGALVALRVVAVTDATNSEKAAAHMRLNVSTVESLLLFMWKQGETKWNELVLP